MRLLPGRPGPGGYRPLVAGPDDERVVQGDVPSLRGARPVVVVQQLSDLHVMDHQSPGRVELLDRYADADLAAVESVGTYRAHELTTHHVVEAMVQALNALAVGPVSGAPVDLAVVTGDMTDDAQANELRDYLALLDGGEVVPDSGDLRRYEGVAASGDPRYWHPQGGCADRPRTVHGFPTVPGLLDAVRRPFDATGLAVPWYAVHGNHDLLAQGTVPTTMVRGLLLGSRKPVTPPAGLDGGTVFRAFEACDPAALAALADSRWADVAPDPSRRPVDRREHVEAHLSSGGHGYTCANLAAGTAYWARDQGEARLIALDTVNGHGGWQGSLDREQLAWLEGEVVGAGTRPVVLLSHHPLRTLVNASNAPGAAPRVLGEEVRAMLLRHPQVVLWLAGHTHQHDVRLHRDPDLPGAFWEVTTASHVDWPQQSRVVELLDAGDRFVVAGTVVDHHGPLHGGLESPLALAGLSRELAANDWQPRLPRKGAGTAADRDVLLALPERR